MIEEIIESPGFWILGGGAVTAEVLGYLYSLKSSSLPAFPLWQFIVLIIGTIIAAAVISQRG